MTDITLFDNTPDLERRVRSRDPESSWDAAKISAEQAATVKSLVRTIVARKGPLTDDEIYRHYLELGGRRTSQRVRTARAELSHPKIGDPLIIEDPIMGVSAAGNKARLWVLA